MRERERGEGRADESGFSLVDSSNFSELNDLNYFYHLLIECQKFIYLRVLSLSITWKYSRQNNDSLILRTGEHDFSQSQIMLIC